MYEHRTAYRHPGTGEVEGFKGTGSTKKAAEKDALEQVRRKIDIAAEFFPHVYDKSNLIASPSRLTPEELATVQKDWASGVRY
jgi:hypothetical protein